MTEEEVRVLMPAKTFISSSYMVSNSKLSISNKEDQITTVIVKISLIGVAHDHNNFIQFVKAIRSKVPAPYKVKFKLTFYL